ncbi:SMP-30/gluconolactonase/LRE family protein [Lentzea sp. CA-135723]|uniref:SMP-30/gluconolactonase/LRE family protein n=1 Tax=Lentzea sp. CA-135723 TaxID=3239950 RepID=UPI003D8A3ED7
MTLTQWNFERLELGEGARWINGRLVVVDLLAGRVLETRGDVPAPFTEIAALPVPVGAVAPVRGGDDLMAASGTGAGLLHGPRQEFAGEGMRVNDAVADPHGRFWVTTMAYDTEPGTGALHRLGSPSPVLKGLTIPNGPAFSPDGEYLYLADSARGTVHRFDVSRDGELGARRVFLHTPNHTPDGMTTDVIGNVWIAFWGASVVRRYRPDGRLDREITLPARQPTSVSLGGPDLSRLFITTAKYGLRRPSLHDGALFAVDVDVPGRPADEVHPAEYQGGAE